MIAKVRFGGRAAIRVTAGLAVLGMVVLAAACGGGGPTRPHAGASPTAATARNAATAAASPAMRGPLSMPAARNAYTAAIVPVYAGAVTLAGKVANHPAHAAPAVARFAARLRHARSRLAAVTAFPASARQAFAALRAEGATVLADLSRPSALRTRAARHRTARDLYALAHRIGVLGIDLGLLPGKGP